MGFPDIQPLWHLALFWKFWQLFFFFFSVSLWFFNFYTLSKSKNLVTPLVQIFQYLINSVIWWIQPLSLDWIVQALHLYSFLSNPMIFVDFFVDFFRFFFIFPHFFKFLPKKTKNEIPPKWQHTITCPRKLIFTLI